MKFLRRVESFLEEKVNNPDLKSAVDTSCKFAIPLVIGIGLGLLAGFGIGSLESEEVAKTYAEYGTAIGAIIGGAYGIYSSVKYMGKRSDKS